MENHSRLTLFFFGIEFDYDIIYRLVCPDSTQPSGLFETRYWQKRSYSYNPDIHRLYLHLLAWPYAHVHLGHLTGKIKYPQFLHDASEVKFHSPGQPSEYSHMIPRTRLDQLTLEIPTVKPWPDVPGQ